MLRTTPTKHNALESTRAKPGNEHPWPGPLTGKVQRLILETASKHPPDRARKIQFRLLSSPHRLDKMKHTNPLRKIIRTYTKDIHPAAVGSVGILERLPQRCSNA